MQKLATRARVITAALVAAGVVTGTMAATATAEGPAERRSQGAGVGGRLDTLNNSGATGIAATHVKGRRLHVKVHARGLASNLPHAQHIHFGKAARHECPSVRDDANGDFRLTTSDGAPAYGPVKVSLTTSGDTGPGSALAVDRFPTAPRGMVRYQRTTRTKPFIARAIRRGNAVVVIHGVDYNHNGEYDFDSAGASDLDSSLPAEATDPAVCGVLRR